MERQVTAIAPKCGFVPSLNSRLGFCVEISRRGVGRDGLHPARSLLARQAAGGSRGPSLRQPAWGYCAWQDCGAEGGGERQISSIVSGKPKNFACLENMINSRSQRGKLSRCIDRQRSPPQIRL